MITDLMIQFTFQFSFFFSIWHFNKLRGRLSLLLLLVHNDEY